MSPASPELAGNDDRSAWAELAPCPVTDSTSPFPADGRSLLSLEGQLRMAEKSAAYGQLAAEAVHEISNLTTIVLFNAELLRESQEHRGRVDKYVDPILRASQLVAALCNQLRNLSRPEHAAPSTVDLAAVVRDIGRLLEQVVDRTFTCTGGDDGPLWVFADPGAIHQVLINLVLNARDASDEENGRIDVRFGAVPGGDPGRAWRYIDVTDNGQGMTPEVRRNLFKPFFTTKPGGRGTGLGLVMIQRMVREMQGRLELATAPGRGTQFRMLLPPAAAPEAVEPEVPAGR